MKNAHRRVIVLTTLVSVLTLTSALLLALAPAPLSPDASSLLAIDTPQGIDIVFRTEVPVNSSRWKHIYIHHSRTLAGDAVSLAESNNGMGDHFVIGNGDGALDGEIQIGQRWTRQLSGVAPKGASKLDPSCISICVIGDFDRAKPTPTQLRRLSQLVGTLQSGLMIPGSKVVTVSNPGPAGVGRYFPAATFRDQLLP